VLTVFVLLASPLLSGPFRWICTSGQASDLRVTDAIATRVLQACKSGAPGPVVQQLEDNLLWISVSG